MQYANTANPASPTDVSLREFALSANTSLIWPFAGIDGVNTIARVMIITAVTNNANLLMPPANQGPIGYTTIIINLSGAAFNIQDNAGGAIDNITAGQVKIVTLRTVATIAGTWLSYTFGATTSAANAALLAGFGLSAITTTLNANYLSVPFSATQSFGTGNRASLAVWTGGAGAANFSSSMTLGNGWWMAFRNAGSGALTLTPSDSIDGAASEAMNPGDSCLVFSTGTALYTVGLGRSVVITDSQTSVNVAGAADVTLSSTQYANNIINLTGVITGNINVIFPTAVKNYWVRNNTTGAFTVTAKTAAGSGSVIPSAGASVVTCDGTNIVSANTSSAGTVSSISAGTGLNGGTIVSAGTISIANTAVTAGSYGSATKFTNFTVNAQGQLTLASDVTLLGKTPIFIPAGAMKARTGASQAGCSALTTITGASNQPDIDYLSFTQSVDQYAKFCVDFGKAWNAGTITAKFLWLRASGNSAANVIWGIRGLAVNTAEQTATNFGTGATVTVAADTTSATNLVISNETSACTLGSPSTPAKSDLCFFEVYRNGANGSDTLGVAAYLIGVLLYYTPDAITDA